MPRIVITCGDPAGVGPEIIAAWLARQTDERHFLTVIGAPRWVATLPSDIRTIPVGPADFVAEPGKPTPDGARVALAAMERAAAGCAAGEFCGVVTGPVGKAQLAEVGFPFAGQTEFFADRWGGEPVMAFAGGSLRVVLLTWHIPLSMVPAALTPAAFARSVKAAVELAAGEGIERPRIAVCGLNPHAGEGGLIGAEERTIINPILDRLRDEFPGVTACLPGDTVFARQLRGEFDVVIALYHDQGLAPLKTVDFDRAVNITLGLPHVRTSPDHGTAYGIAGTGRADGGSFDNAVKLARRLILARGGQ